MSKPFVTADTAAFLGFLAANAGPRVYEVSAAQARALFRTLVHLAELPVGELAVKRDLQLPGPAGPLAARLFDARAERDPGPLAVFFHGGGFVLGDLDTHASFCAEAARRLDLPVLAVDYRLAPEHPYPAAHDDCEAAARWAAQSPEALGRGVTELVLLGDSAGANLALGATLALRDRPASARVRALLALYPVVSDSADWESHRDFADGYVLTAESIAHFGRCYRWDAKDPRAVPLGRELAGMPPTLVLTASLDPLRDQGRAFAAELARAGVRSGLREARGQVHGFLGLRKAIPSAQREAVAALDAFRAMLAEPL